MPSSSRSDVGTWRRPLVPGPVTICVISYNYGRFLAQAVDSALAQTIPSGTVVRVLVVDDGSTDDTAAVARRYGDLVEYVPKQNGGLSDARNVGAANCTTPWLLYLDADNWLPTHHLERLFAALASDEAAAFAYCQLTYVGLRAETTTFGSWDVERLKRGNYVDAGALLPAELVQRRPFDTRLRAGLEDWDFFLGLASDGYRGVLADTATCFRVHGDNMGIGVQRRSWRRRATYARILLKHRRFLGLGFVAGMVRRSVRARLAALRK